MTTYYRCPECNGNGHHLHVEAEVPYCQTCYDMVPVTIDYEAAIREWEYYEQDVDPHENRTYEQMIRDVVDAALGDNDE